MPYKTPRSEIGQATLLLLGGGRSSVVTLMSARPLLFTFPLLYYCTVPYQPINKSARRRRDATERRRSAQQMELERRRQLEHLEEISRQDAILSASARSTAMHRVKAAKLEAAKTAAADSPNASLPVGGGGGGDEGPRMSLTMRQHHRRDSYSGARGLNINRLVGRHPRQAFRGSEFPVSLRYMVQQFEVRARDDVCARFSVSPNPRELSTQYSVPVPC